MTQFMENIINSNEPHQEILNTTYAEWQKNKSWNYSDMIDYAANSFGKFAALALLVGKYNQQVTNGGHMQYFHNGYASRDSGGCFSNHDNIELHIEMLDLMKEFGFENEPVYAIMKGFDIVELDCEECGGTGQLEEYDEEEDEYTTEHCWTCNGKGSNGNMEGKGHDDGYYKIYEAWMKTFEAALVARYTVKLAA